MIYDELVSGPLAPQPAASTISFKFDPNQPRDPHSGEWTDDPSSAASSTVAVLDDVLQRTAEHATKMRTAYDNGYEVKRQFNSGNTAEAVELLELSDGSQVVRKTLAPKYSQLRREVLSGRIANAIGIDDVVTAQVSDNEIITTHLNGLTGARAAKNAYDQQEDKSDGNADIIHKRLADAQADLPGGREIGLLDWLIMNPDRHAGNWIVTPDNQVRPIDHGNAQFRTVNTDGYEREPMSPFSDKWASGGWLSQRDAQNMVIPRPKITRAELTRVRVQIEALRSEFSGPNEDKWYASVLEKLTRLEDAVTK